MNYPFLAGLMGLAPDCKYGLGYFPSFRLLSKVVCSAVNAFGIDWDLPSSALLRLPRITYCDATAFTGANKGTRCRAKNKTAFSQTSLRVAGGGRGRRGKGKKKKRKRKKALIFGT